MTCSILSALPKRILRISNRGCWLTEITAEAVKPVLTLRFAVMNLGYELWDILYELD